VVHPSCRIGEIILALAAFAIPISRRKPCGLIFNVPSRGSRMQWPAFARRASAGRDLF
jgi:hypothetical protein